LVCKYTHVKIYIFEFLFDIITIITLSGAEQEKKFRGPKKKFQLLLLNIYKIYKGGAFPCRGPASPLFVTGHCKEKKNNV
jgi:hypothetical protein